MTSRRTEGRDATRPARKRTGAARGTPDGGHVNRGEQVPRLGAPRSFWNTGLVTEDPAGFGPGHDYLSTLHFDALRGGHFHVRGETARAGALEVVRLRVASPTEVHAVGDEPVFGACVAMDSWGSGRYFGQPLPPGALLTFEPDARFWLVGDGETEFVTALMSRARLEYHAETLQIAPAEALRDMPRVLRPPTIRIEEMRRLCLGTLSRCGQLGDSPLPAAMASHLEVQAAVLLLVAFLGRSRQRAVGRPRASYDRLVSRMRELVTGEPHLAPTLTDACQRLHVGLRTLNYACQHAVGTSAAEYLRILRMNRVREDLLGPDARAGMSVAQIALRWGFWHSSQFARQYRELFGELPSHTLRRTRAGRRRPARKRETAAPAAPRRRRGATATGRNPKG